MLYNVVLVSAIQYKSAMSVYIYISLLCLLCLLSLIPTPHPSIPGIWVFRVPSWALCYMVTSPSLSVSHMLVCICQCCSLNLSHPLLQPCCVHKSILYICFYSCPANRPTRTIFLDSIYIYVLIYDSFFLCDLYHSV